MLQTRDIKLDDAEIKFSGTSDVGEFEGYASVFGGVDSYGDTIVKGAYQDTISERKSPVLMLFGHNPGRVIGKWTGLAEDDHGLHVRGEFTPGHTDAQNARASMRHGALSGLSIGFRIPEGGAEKTEAGGRLLKKINLIEISAVSMPADDAARVSLDSVKSLIEDIETVRDLELFLRDTGPFSRATATAVVARCKSVFQGEPGELAKLMNERDELRKALIEAKAELLRLKYKLL